MAPDYKREPLQTGMATGRNYSHFPIVSINLGVWVFQIVPPIVHSPQTTWESPQALHNYMSVRQCCSSVKSCGTRIGGGAEYKYPAATRTIGLSRFRLNAQQSNSTSTCLCMITVRTGTSTHIHSHNIGMRVLILFYIPCPF